MALCYTETWELEPVVGWLEFIVDRIMDIG